MLGSNFTLGSRIPDRSGKFLLCINNLSRDRLLSFLPNGLNFIPLTLFVAFILRDQLARDLRLGFAPEQAGAWSGAGTKLPVGMDQFYRAAGARTRRHYQCQVVTR